MRSVVAIAVVALMLSSVAAAGASASGPRVVTNQPPAGGTSIVLNKATITFTGDVQSDFAGDLIYYNYNTSAWGSANNITGLYAAYNSTDLFLGLNGSADGNSVMFFLANETSSPFGTTNITDLAAWSGHNINFTSPINYVGAVYSAKANSEQSGQTVLRITSPVTDSNTVNLASVPIANSWTFGASGYEVAINWSGLFPSGVPSGAIGLRLSAFVAGGGAWLGMGAPFLQQGLYNDGGSIPYFLVNDTFSIVAPDVVQHTTTLTQESVTFTGDVQSDFAGDLIYYNYNTTPWGSANNITGLYAAYNSTDLFLGLNGSADGNSIMFFLANETSSPFGTTNITDLAAWSGHNINFTSPINYVGAVYSAKANSEQSGQTVLRITSPVTDSNTTSLASVPIANNWTFGTSGYELRIPWTGLYPSGLDGPAGLQISAFVAGGGAWVGMGAPFPQIGKYSNGGSQVNFVVNDSLSILVPYLDIPSSYVPPVIPIQLDIIFNDHQPFYQSISSPTSYLPWTVVHLEEYVEQALIAGQHPTVNVTYSLSGSLLYQIEAIAAGDYNNSYLQTAWIPTSQWSNSVYTEMTQYGDTFLGALVQDSAWNTTNVSQVIEFDMAFNTPLWVYTAGTAASNLYHTLFNIEQSQIATRQTMSTANLTDALVEFFLWAASYPVISGQLGSQYANSTMMALYGDSSFTVSDLRTIEAYYPAEATLTLASFLADRMLNNNTKGNVELLTTAFDHPILPLLLLNNWTGESGDSIVKGVWTNDTEAQLNISRDLYDRIFGQYPTGLWSSEQAVSDAVVQYINSTGYAWTSSSEATLAEAGISTPGSTPTAQQMENLYTPYRVMGPGNATSTVMVFRDDSLSNDWGFNYGGIATTKGSWAAVGSFMSYLENVESTIPNSLHNDTLVTVALDGENWMFSGFPEDAVPFLEDLYTALAQNSSWVVTTTVQQYMASHPDLPVLATLPIGSWNAEPAGTGISEYLGQWAGHGPQDSTWQQLTLVRSEVQSYGTANGLTQPTNQSQLTAYNNFPYLSQWNATTAQGKYDEAWMAIYLAEASDITFSFDPGDESLTAQNAIVFENEFRADLSQALTVLGIPLTPFLSASYIVPLSPTVWGTNQSDSPVLSGALLTSSSFTGGTGYSVNDNNAWNGAYQKASGDTTLSAGIISDAYYAFDANDLFFSVAVNGATSAYKAPNFYTAASDQLDIFFSEANPGAGDLLALAVPDSVYTVGTTPFGFAATTEISIEGSSVTSSGSASLAIYTSSASGTWTYSTAIAGDAFVGGMLQLEVPLTSLGMTPGDSVEFLVAALNSTSGAVLSSEGPLEVTVPASLATLTLISTIHNPAPSDGTGNYTYPTQMVGTVPDYPPNSVDMQWVNVSMNAYNVEFNLTFGNLSNVFAGPFGFTQPIIDIYVHEPGATGSTTGLPGVNINLAANSAWEWVIQAAGWASNSYVESSTGVTYPTAALVSTNYVGTTTVEPDRTVSIEVSTALIGTAITSYNYTIVCGFQDGYATNGWDTVNIGPASAYQGGGANNSEAPYVFSYIAPAVVGLSSSETQQSLLNSYTKTSYATLVAVPLPLVTTKKTVVATLGDSAIVNSTSGYEAFYSVGSEVYRATSTTGVTWTTPSPLVNLSWVPVGIAAAGTSTVGWMAWNGSNYAFENLATGTFSNGTASGAIESAALTYSGGAFYVALDVGGTVTIRSPGSTTVLGTDSLGADAIGLTTTAGGSTYLAYTTATKAQVTTLTLTSSSASFGSSTVLSAPLPTGAVASGIAVAVASNGAVGIAVAAKNASGSDIYVANGTGTLRAVATDGTDYSPSLVLGSGSKYPVYVGFSDFGGTGNVFFIPTPVASLTTTPTTVSPSPSTPAWEWIAIAVVVIVIVLAIALLAMRRKPKQPTTAPTPGSVPETPAPEAPSAPSGETSGSEPPPVEESG